MSDIVERAKQCAEDTEDWKADVILHECVARIEKLEAALRDALSYSTIGDMPVTIYENARAALEERT